MLDSKEAIAAIKQLMLLKKDLWVEGHTVSMYYDADDDLYHVCTIDDDTFEVNELTYNTKHIDEGINKFLEWFKNDRISFTDGEINA